MLWNANEDHLCGVRVSRPGCRDPAGLLPTRRWLPRTGLTLWSSCEPWPLSSTRHTTHLHVSSSEINYAYPKSLLKTAVRGSRRDRSSPVPGGRHTPGDAAGHGLHTSTSPLLSMPSARRPISSGRATCPGRDRGTCSLVASSTPGSSTPAMGGPSRPAQPSVILTEPIRRHWFVAASS
jgi:hypothetical protein